MKQAAFEKQHLAAWRRFSRLLDAMERNKLPSKDNSTFASLYRQICQHQALAEARGYSSQLIERLQQLTLRGHQQFYRHRSHLGARSIAFLLGGFPHLVRNQWRFVLAAALCFYGGLLAMGLLVFLQPELVYSVISPEQVRAMESMYDPDASRLGRFAERASSEDWLMFGYYIMNNIGIAFQTFASGLLFGLGSLFFLLFNGLMIGAVGGHLSQIGYGEPFWSFVIGHGAFELNAIVLAGAAGLQLGWALLAPGRYSRSEALRLAARLAIQLLCGAALFLFIAAFVEAYWSSMTWPGATFKYLVGAGLWLLVFGYLAFAGRKNHAPD